MTLEQVATATNAITWTIWGRNPHDLNTISEINQYHQLRNAISYASRRKRFESLAL